MKDRLVTLGFALGAFALFYALMLHRPAAPQETVTRPQSIERGPNGYLALMRWLDAIGLPHVSLRDRFTHLDDREIAPGTGNVLITTMPHRYPLRDSELAPLRDWIAEGNTLLIVAGLSDTPDWSMGEGADPAFLAHLQAITGLRFQQIVPEPAASGNKAPEQPKQVPDEHDPQQKASPAPGPSPLLAFRKLDPPLAFDIAPTGTHPLLEGVESIGAVSDFPTARWNAYSPSGLMLELARDASGTPALWLVPHGRGQIVVSAYGSILVNRLLGEKDNARWLANLLRWTVEPGGRVIIDDAHQGLVAFYDAAAFYGDKRLHRTLWWLVALWLVFVLGSQRLRAGTSHWRPLDVTNFVRASGGFMARVLKPATAAQQLLENFFNELRRQIGLPLNGAPVWDWIAAHGAISERDLAQLQQWHGRSQRGRRLDLPALQNLLNRIRHQLI